MRFLNLKTRVDVQVFRLDIHGLPIKWVKRQQTKYRQHSRLLNWTFTPAELTRNIIHGISETLIPRSKEAVIKPEAMIFTSKLRGREIKPGEIIVRGAGKEKIGIIR
jgi:hypothetical protein